MEVSQSLKQNQTQAPVDLWRRTVVGDAWTRCMDLPPVLLLTHGVIQSRQHGTPSGALRCLDHTRTWTVLEYGDVCTNNLKGKSHRR